MMSEREVRKIASEHLRSMNQGLETIGSAMRFRAYVEGTYVPVAMPLLAKTTRQKYQGILDNYLLPTFGDAFLRDMTTLNIQRYFSQMANSELSRESRDKVRDVLSAVLRSAKEYGVMLTNPAETVRVPADKRGKKKFKQHLTPEQFENLLLLIPEPYASMAFVAIYTGLRVSELAGLRWDDIHEDSITIDERYCRSAWGAPKSDASNASVGVNRCVIERIHRMKLLKVEVKAGTAVRRYRVVKSDGPNDLVFQSVQMGRPIRDNDILSRFIKPAARAVGVPWVNWRSLRTSHCVWLKLAGADMKDAQGQMRHSRASTTMDIYMQFVPESQRRVVDRLSGLSNRVQQVLGLMGLRTGTGRCVNY
jgi:integrase